MIKIINGTFGYNNGKSIIPKTSKDEPFECDKSTEKRLVDIGVAVYVDANKSDADADGGADVTREDLIAQFKALGLKGNPAVMKDETLKAKIAEAKNAKNADTKRTRANA